jgi:arginine exporter protein ArgO
VDTGRQVQFTLLVSSLNPHAILDTVGVIGTSSLAYSGAERSAFAAARVAVSWVYFLRGLSLRSVCGPLRPARGGPAMDEQDLRGSDLGRGGLPGGCAA